MSENTTQDTSEEVSEEIDAQLGEEIANAEEAPEVEEISNDEPAKDLAKEAEDFASEIVGDDEDEAPDQSESEEEPETKEETPVVEETKTETPQEEEQTEKEPITLNVEKPSRMESRIAQLYLQTELLKGSNNLPAFDEVLKEVKNYSRDEQEKALHNLLTEKRQLKGEDTEQPLSNEDQEILIEAEVEKRQLEWEREQNEKDFHADLVKTLEAHPELDSTHKDFNKSIHDSVEVFVENGMKASDAYNLVMKQIEDVKAKAQEEAKKIIEIEKQKALSGTMSSQGTPKDAPKPKTKADQFADEILGY